MLLARHTRNVDISGGRQLSAPPSSDPTCLGPRGVSRGGRRLFDGQPYPSLPIVLLNSPQAWRPPVRSNPDASKDRAARPHSLTFVLVSSTLVTPSHSIVTFNPICTACLRTPAQPPDLLLHSWYIVVSSFRHVIQPEPFSAGNIRFAFTALVPAKRVS